MCKTDGGNLLYGAGSSAQRSVMIWTRGVGRWEGSWEGDLYAYVELIHFIVQQKLTQHCKAIMLRGQKKPVIMVAF